MYIRFLILFFFIHRVEIYAQTEGIDSMRNRLPFLSGEARVDCMNRLSEQFCYHWIHADSALSYSHAAFQEASLIPYRIGMGEALIREADVQGKLLGQPREMVLKSTKALEIVRNTGNARTLALAYKALALGLTLVGDYHRAVDTAIIARQLAVDANDKQLIGWTAETIGFAYAKSGAYWKAFEHLIEAQRIGKEVNDSLLVAFSLAFIVRSFNRAADSRKALEYY